MYTNPTEYCPLYHCCSFISFLDFELGAGDKDLTMQALLVFDNNIFRKYQILRKSHAFLKLSQLL